MKTHEQKMAEAAFGCVNGRKNTEIFDDYCRFSSSFPALIHSCGLAQALSFAEAKNKSYIESYIDDLQTVLDSVEKAGNIAELSRSEGIEDYIRISRRVISAASWIKRYAQALEPKTKKGIENNVLLQ